MYLPLPCKDEEFHAILNTMFDDDTIKSLRPYKVPTKEEKSDPRYCHYHQFVGHPTTACQTLRNILHAEIHDGTLELPFKSYNTPWLLANGWENGSSGEVFTLDMVEECHSWASFGQQDYQETAAITSHNLTAVEESVMGCELQITL
ncbi:unnamed protein product [Prunus armeniaca]